MPEEPDIQQPDQVQPDEPELQGSDLEPEERALADPQEESEPENPETAEEQMDPETQESQMSRRKAKRLEKLEGLVERLKGRPQPGPRNRAAGVNYREMIDADDQVYDQLDRATRKYGEELYSEGLRHADDVRFHTRLEIDTPRVESGYPQLNSKDRTNFNPYLTSAINNFYLGMVGFDARTGNVANPNLRYSDFVDALAELGEAMYSTRATKSSQNIARQADNTGLRPNGPGAKPLDLTKAPQDMSIEELRAAAQASMPRDTRGRFTSR